MEMADVARGDQGEPMRGGDPQLVHETILGSGEGVSEWGVWTLSPLPGGKGRSIARGSPLTRPVYYTAEAAKSSGITLSRFAGRARI